VKKSFVFLLLALALVVIVSPGIVGKLAEQSMDENLDWAATESREFKVTSQGFDRGWFSSAGRHRIELNAGDARDVLDVVFRDSGFSGTPALIIDTRIDHGLVPVSSMSREQGSLAPGLGSAISTLQVEFDDGDMVDIPAMIFSKVGLTGDLQSNFVVEPGTFSDGGETMQWGSVDALITMSASSNTVGFSGVIDEVVLASPGDEFTVGAITFEGEQQATPFGLSVGDADISIASITYPSEFGSMETGPLNLTSVASLDGDLVSARTTLDVEYVPLGELGPATIGFDIAFDKVDAASISRISDVLDDFESYGSGDALRLAVENDVRTLFARGFAVRLDRLDIAMPPGTVSAALAVDVAPTDIGPLVVTSILLAMEARLSLSVPAELYDYAVTLDPQVGAAVAMGFLRKDGNDYKLQAEFSNGLLTVNGAPMPGIIPGLN
jgi:uncharacterized protein YdgA (DUF945 family)